MSFQIQYGSSKLPQKFYTGEVDAFWRSETSFDESRLNYLVERDKLRKAQTEVVQHKQSHQNEQVTVENKK